MTNLGLINELEQGWSTRPADRILPASWGVMALSWEWFLKSTFAINLMTGCANVEPQFSEIHASPQKDSSLFLSRPVLKRKVHSIIIIFLISSLKNVVEIQDRPVGIIKLTLQLL